MKINEEKIESDPITSQFYEAMNVPAVNAAERKILLRESILDLKFHSLLPLATLIILLNFQHFLSLAAYLREMQKQF